MTWLIWLCRQAGTSTLWYVGQCSFHPTTATVVNYQVIVIFMLANISRVFIHASHNAELLPSILPLKPWGLEEEQYIISVFLQKERNVFFLLVDFYKRESFSGSLFFFWKVNFKGKTFNPISLLMTISSAFGENGVFIITV